MKRTLTIVSLFPRDMNLYGDGGNLLAITRRAHEHGYETVVVEVNIGDPLPQDIDIVVGGGGQDSGQVRIAHDLAQHGPALRSLAEDGVPMLVVCGMFQLFGHRFLTSTGDELVGIGVLDVETRGGDERLIGNVVAQSDEFGEVIGFENHSGYTTLGTRARPLGNTAPGAGNNPTDGVEGARYRNVIGTYLHGSFLPNNPAVTDYLIEAAARRRYGDFSGARIDDRTAREVRQRALQRER